MEKLSKIFIVIALMCVSAAAAYSQDCNSYLQLATELVSQKNYCAAKEYYQKYRNCNSDADVNTEITMCEKFCKTQKMENGDADVVSPTDLKNNAPSQNTLVQDIIILKDGTEISAKVQEVGIDEVKYKRIDNLNGPVYTLKKSDVFMIRYSNGSKDVFADKTPPPPTQDTTPVDTKSQASVNQPNNSYGESSNSQQQLKQPPMLKYTFGNQISPDGSKKSPFLAGFLSFLIPGVGQFYNGDIGGGFLYMGCNIVCNSVWMNSIKTDNYGNTSINETQFTIGFIGALIVNISSIVNAAQGAKNVNIARGYYLGGNTYLNIQPTMIQQNNLLTGKEYAYGMKLCLNF